MSLERLPFTILFGGSIFFTLGASMARGGYFYVILCTAIQIFSLLWYIMSYFPGGSTAMWYTSKILYRTARGYMSMMWVMLRSCCQLLISRLLARMASG